MSRTKSFLLCGAVCCLIISLVIPVTSGNGTNTNSEVSAAGPKFLKLWQNKSSGSSKSGKSTKKPVKSYPMPKEVRQRYAQPRQSEHVQVRQTPQPAPVQNGAQGETPVMKELQELYRENGQQAPNMTRHQARREQSQKHQKSKNVFSRAYDKIVGKPNTYAKPRPSLEHQPEGLPNWNEKKPNQVASKNSNPASSGDTNNVIIIPPQPQPGFLPGLDVADLEGTNLEPTAPAETKSSNNDNFFPLPPLPSDLNSSTESKTVSVDEPSISEEVVSSTDDSFSVALPLPGMKTETVAREQIAENKTEKPALKIDEPKALEPKALEPEVPETSSFSSNNNLVAREPIPSGKSGLPLAPSVGKTNNNKELPPTYQGWRSRTGQPQRLEPNTLNAPNELRPTTSPQQTVARKQDPSEKYRRIAERGTREGFKGFCPAVLRDELELVDASLEYRAEYEGSVYYFSSAQAQQQFQTNPTRYAPAWGGIDLVTYAEQGIEKAGRLDFAVWYRDRLHFFSSQENMTQFKAHPEKFIPEK